ncbi:lipoyl synthase [Plasticicumulans acidivorans]|uniref:Lipoyl synthase n=1 Tax=Plasticicumulans acidivorans TaxID=886464 RepID=A0A317MQW8_9GAMM|nr:lipoyl synthase [Plasticicumulans acidivorans]PWV59091.1 lipoic acid synthetase [Plasticicumulans acidivorans]
MTNPSEPVALRGGDKLARIPVKVDRTRASPPKPAWLRARDPGLPAVRRLQALLRAQGLVSVCEEAACPNIGECFSRGTATFMILGGICTRRCPYCDVAHGRPAPPDAAEPAHLGVAIRAMGLRYVVITSVDRDDLRDGGAGHFAACIAAAREASPGLRVEVLTPDFRGRETQALAALAAQPPDVFNHNIETVPRLYRAVRPGGDYRGSLTLLARARERLPGVPTKSGLMLGLGERDEDVVEVMRDLRAHGCDILTLGQYLRPSAEHLPVARYVSPPAFEALRTQALALGFAEVAAGPLVRSSYRADQVAAAAGLGR